MTEFKKGIGYLVKQNPTVDVIPVYLEGLHKTLPKGKNLILPYNCRIIFGDSINFDSFDLEDIINEAEKAIHKVKSLVE